MAPSICFYHIDNFLSFYTSSVSPVSLNRRKYVKIFLNEDSASRKFSMIESDQNKRSIHVLKKRKYISLNKLSAAVCFVKGCIIVFIKSLKFRFATSSGPQLCRLLWLLLSLMHASPSSFLQNFDEMVYGVKDFLISLSASLSGGY